MSAIIPFTQKHEDILNEHTDLLTKHSQILNDHTKKLDCHSQILDRHSKILNEHTRKLDKHTLILNAHSKKLDEHSSGLHKLGILVEDVRATLQAVLEIVKHINERYLKQDEMEITLEKHEYRISAVESVLLKHE